MKCSMKQAAIIVGLGLTISHQAAAIESAQFEPKNRFEDNLYEQTFYQTSMSGEFNSLPQMQLFRASVSGLDSCDGNIGHSISNAFTNGTVGQIFDNFEDVVDGVMSKGGAAFLGITVLKMTNPGLMATIENGLSIFSDDFLGALGSCEAMIDNAVHMVANPSREPMTNGYFDSKLRELGMTQKSDSSFDIVGFMRSGVNNGVGKGVEWISGEAPVGGNSQAGIEPEKDFLGRGYCLMRGGRMVNGSCIPSSSGEQLTDREKELFPTDTSLKSFGTEVVGSSTIRVCDGCNNDYDAPKGLKLEYKRQVQRIGDKLNFMIGQSLVNVDEDDYKAISSPYMRFTVEHLRILKSMSGAKLERHKNAVIDDLAYQWTMEKGEILYDALNQGSRSPEFNELYAQAPRDLSLKNYDDAVNALDRMLRSRGFRPRQGVVNLIQEGSRMSIGQDSINSAAAYGG